MDIERYSFFLQVVEDGNLTRAAQNMGYTQSGASHIIKSLENELGVRLLTRGHFGIRLTAEAELMLPAIRSVVAADRKIHEIANSVAGLKCGTLRIAAFTSICLAWLPRLVGSFHALYPDVKVKIISGNGTYGEMETFLRDGTVDISFVRTPLANRFQTLHLMEDPLYLVLPPTHPLAAQPEPITFAQLEGQPMLMPSDGNNEDILQLFAEHQYTPNIALTMRDDVTLLSLAENGIGFTILPNLILKTMPHHAADRRLEGNPARNICIATRPDEGHSPLVSAFIQVIRESLFAAPGPDGLSPAPLR